MHIRKAVIAVVIVVSLFIASPFAYMRFWSAIDAARVAPYDAGYRQLEMGMPTNDVERLMGQPNDVAIATKDSSRAFGIDTFYVYRVERRYRHPVKWHIGIDANGRIVSLHRDDDGC
jgi:hypothetical protein